MPGFNWVDAILIVIIALFALFATARGFLQVLAGLLGFVLTLVAALAFYPNLAHFLETHTVLPMLWAAPAAFVAIWIIAQIAFGLLMRLLVGTVLFRSRLSVTDRVLALIPGAIHATLVVALVVTLLSLVPLSWVPREAILNSAIGSRMVSGTMALEQPLEEVFGPALKETLGFLTVQPEPGSEETVELGYSVPNPTAAIDDEERMFALVNSERTQRGLTPLAMDDSLQRLARAYASQMFQQGYFSHVDHEGRDPFARMRDAGISYTAAGENLALSPTVEIAHDGLMASPGHRANILNPDFRKVGIGVVDGGVHGKMFVQEFTD